MVKGNENMSSHITVVTGRLSKDPELRYFNNGSAVCNLSIPVTERWGSGDEQKEKNYVVQCVCMG